MYNTVSCTVLVQCNIIIYYNNSTGRAESNEIELGINYQRVNIAKEKDHEKQE